MRFTEIADQYKLGLISGDEKYLVKTHDINRVAGRIQRLEEQKSSLEAKVAMLELKLMDTFKEAVYG